ncbi:MAG: hypothetical protein ABL886_00475 [Rhodoglobus sp.]
MFQSFAMWPVPLLDITPLPAVIYPSRVDARRGRARSALRPASFFDPNPIAQAVPTFFSAVFPPVVKKLQGPTSSTRRQSYAAPVDRPFDPTSFLGAIPHVFAQRIHKVVRVSHRRPAFFMPSTIIANPTVVPVGPTPAAVLVVNPEIGSTVTLEWQTDVQKSESGLERRSAKLRNPRMRVKFSCTLDDSEHRRVLDVLSGNAHAATPFLLGLPHEGFTIDGSAGVVVNVSAGTLTSCDWAMQGQRVVVVRAIDGQARDSYIVSTSGGSITLADDLSAFATRHSRIMPGVSVVLRPDIAMGRYSANAGQVSIEAIAQQFGYGDGTRPMGVDVTLATHDGIPVWDRGVDSSSMVGQPIYSGTEEVDLGGLPTVFQHFSVVDYGRELGYTDTITSGWQYLKRFLWTCRGMQKKFLLASGRPDLIPVGDASGGTLTISTADNDYVSTYFPSLAHRHLKIFVGGVGYLVTVTGAVDGGATQSLTIVGTVPAGTVERVEFLETVRMHADVFEVTFMSNTLDMKTETRTVQR